MSGYNRGLAVALCLAIIPGHVLAQKPVPAPPPSAKTGYTFTFVEKNVSYRMPNWVEVRGKLDQEGTFIPDPPAAQPPEPGSVTRGASGYPIMYSVAINDRRRFHNDTHSSLDDAPKVEFVYEYRSGVLIPGQLIEGGYFVPRAGAKIVPFADYVPGAGAQRIYNLPGEFVPVKK